MSRVGKQPVVIPEGVTVEVEGNTLAVKGPRGELRRALPSDIQIALENGTVTFTPRIMSQKTPARWGLARALAANMIQGVVSGFEKKLEFEGIGYRVSVEGDGLKFLVGFSHPVLLKAPAGIQFRVEKNVIAVSGINNELVGETAARIRALKPAEPYKGKGIRYQGEVIQRKVGKKAAASA